MFIVQCILFIILNTLIQYSNSSTSRSSNNSNTIQHYSLLLNKNDDYTFQWSVDYAEEKQLHFNICYNLNNLNNVTNQHWSTLNDQLKLFGVGFGRKDEPVNLDMYMLYFPLFYEKLHQRNHGNYNNENRKDVDYLFLEAYTDENAMLHIRDSVESQLYSVEFPHKWKHHNIHQNLICFNFGRMATSCRENGYSIDNQTTHLYLFHSTTTTNEHYKKHDMIYELWLDRLGLSSILSLNNLDMRKRISYQKILLQLIKSSTYTDFKMTDDVKIFSVRVNQNFYVELYTSA
ncbi:unnamed protein product [Schistosoma turkestanicum]|nr:unnamed protein product [Schistosoma turkestanicum]